MYRYRIVCDGSETMLLCAGIALQEGTGTISFYDKEGIVLAIFPATAVVLLINIEKE